MGGGHHRKQGGCAESEIDGAEQMAAGETPELDLLGLNVRKPLCTLALDSRQHLSLYWI